MHAGDRLSSIQTRPGDPGVPSTVGWSDEEGDHFVTFPDAITDVETVEYLVPKDPRADALERVYDTSKGRSTADWRLTNQRVCRAEGGYNDAFTRWMDGSSLEQITADLGLSDPAEARDYVRHALTRLTRRYYRDR